MIAKNLAAGTALSRDSRLQGACAHWGAPARPGQKLTSSEFRKQHEIVIASCKSWGEMGCLVKANHFCPISNYACPRSTHDVYKGNFPYFSEVPWIRANDKRGKKTGTSLVPAGLGPQPATALDRLYDPTLAIRSNVFSDPNYRVGGVPGSADKAAFITSTRSPYTINFTTAPDSHDNVIINTDVQIRDIGTST